MTGPTLQSGSEEDLLDKVIHPKGFYIKFSQKAEVSELSQKFHALIQ